jgi:hypothetical protein
VLPLSDPHGLKAWRRTRCIGQWRAATSRAADDQKDIAIMLRTLSLSAFILAGTAALAQNPQPASPSNPTVAVAPPNAPAPPPEKIAPSSGNLSDRMSQQKGTIAPPNVDPGMTVHPPQNSSATTPVIPPPGSPGSNGSVIPK